MKAAEKETEHVICADCAEDRYLKKRIRDSGRPRICTVCEKRKKHTFSMAELAEELGPIIQEHYRQGEDVKQFGPDDKEWYEQEGDPLNDIVQEVLGQYFGFEEAIIDALINWEDVDVRDGEIPFFDNSQNYVEKRVSTHVWRSRWEEVLTGLKHRHRFFNVAATEYFRELLVMLTILSLRCSDELTMQ